MSYKTKFNSIKFALIGVSFGFLGLMISTYIVLFQEYPLPRSIKRLLLKNPDATQFIDSIVYVIGVSIFLFSVLIFDLSIRFILSRKYKNLHLEIDAKNVSLPNFLVGEQYMVPVVNISSVTKDEQGVKLVYDTTEGSETIILASSFIEKTDEVYKNISDAVKSHEKKFNSVISYFSVVCSRNDISEKSKEKTLLILSKLLRLTHEQVLELYERDNIIIKANLAEDKCIQIQDKLKNIGLTTRIIRVEHDSKLPTNPMPVRFISLFTISAIILVPGGVFAWLFFIKKYMSRKFENFKLSISVLFMAFVIEFEAAYSFASDLPELSLVLMTLLRLGLCSAISFSLMKSIQDSTHIKTSTLGAIFLGFPYINHKINKALESA